MSDLQDKIDEVGGYKSWSQIMEAAKRVANPDYRLVVCVTHWRIYQAQRAEPFAEFGFHLCPVEEGTEHVVVNFVALGIRENK